MRDFITGAFIDVTDVTFKTWCPVCRVFSEYPVALFPDPVPFYNLPPATVHALHTSPGYLATWAATR